MLCLEWHLASSISDWGWRRSNRVVFEGQRNNQRFDGLEAEIPNLRMI